MSVESQEFIQLRNDTYDAERSKCPPEVIVEPDVDELPICLCCGERKRMRPMMHVCQECFEQ